MKKSLFLGSSSALHLEGSRAVPSDPFLLDSGIQFFCTSAALQGALLGLQTSLRFKRGLSVVLGDVGLGKTMFSRMLAQRERDDHQSDVHLVENPIDQSEFQFLDQLCKRLGISRAPRSSADCLEALQQELYERGRQSERATVLFIDEGQNLSLPILEALRTLIGYEIRQRKCLQLLIFAQLEALPKFHRIPGFMDRVHFKYVMNPLSAAETRDMIRFRLDQAGWTSVQPFTDEALQSIFEESQGYPRRIMLLCQNLMRTYATTL